MSTYTKIISVDAGIVMIGDPCYTWPSDAASRTKYGNGDWQAFCNALYENDKESDKPTMAEPFGAGMGVVVASGYGDGAYTLTIETTDEGIWGERVKSVTLTFIEDDYEKENGE